MRAILHINRHVLARNKKDGGSRPVYAIKTSSKVVYAHGLTIRGTTRFIDPRDDPPLACGATIYAAIDGDITMVEPCHFNEIDP